MDSARHTTGARASAPAPRRRVVIVGLGNIGSHLAPHVARMTDVSHVVLIDKGRYGNSNVVTQAITPGESGRGKAQVQGLRLRRIRPALEVTSIAAPAEGVPLGRLRADVILACADSRSARLYLNQAARHLGVPLVDAGVFADGMLARVSTYFPSDSCACLECAWDQRDYDAVEQTYPCLPGDAPDAPSTGAPAELGALAAALQAIECRRILGGLAASVDGSHEVIVDAHWHRILVTRFERSTRCRLAAHTPWRISRLGLPSEVLTLGEALGLGASGRGVESGRLELEGLAFVTALTCLGCGETTPLLRLRRALTPRERMCKSCNGRREAVGTHVTPSLGSDHVTAGAGDRSLRAIGLESGDIFAVRRGADTRYYELPGEADTPRPGTPEGAR